MTAWRPRHLSVSSVALYATCPAQFHARYVQKLVTPTTAPQATGTAFHAALEAEHRGQDSEHAWIAAANAVEANLAASGQSLTMSKSDGLALLNLYRERFGEVRGEPEKQIRLRFPTAAIPVPLLGYVDLILPDEIREFKTSGSGWWTEAKAATAFQTAVYGWAHTQLYRRRVPIRYVIFRTDTVTLEENLVEYSPEIFRVFEQTAEMVWAAIVAGEYPPCGECKELCKPPIATPRPGPIVVWDEAAS